MEKLVLVGIDPGYRDVSALQWPIEWATATDQEVLVVSGFEIGQAEVSPEFHDEMLEEAHLLIDAKIDCVERRMRAPTRSLIVEGHPTQVLIDAVHAEDPSVVVLGSFGEGGYDQLAVGGVAHRVMAKLSRPVVLVRHLGGPVSHGEIIVGIDGPQGTNGALEWALDAALRTGSRVAVVVPDKSMVPDVQRAVEGFSRAGEQTNGAVGRSDVIAVEGDHVGELVRLADERAASMIVVHSEGAGRLSGLLAGDEGSRLIEKAGRPVVIVHRP